jgi:arylsulfatase
MRSLLLSAAALLLYIASANAQDPQQAPAAKAKQPNIVVVLASDLGYGDIGAYGQTKIETPNIDELALRGVKLTNFYSGSSSLAPSLCVLLTGKNAGRSAIRGTDEWAERGSVMNYVKVLQDSTLEGQRPMPASEQTIASLLKSKGYRTAVVGLWGLGSAVSEGAPLKHGFDYFYGYSCLRQAQLYYPKHLWENSHRVKMDNALVFPNLKLPSGADPYNKQSYAAYTLDHYAPDSILSHALSFVGQNDERPFFLLYSAQLPQAPLQNPKKFVESYARKLGDEEPYLGLNGGYPNRTPRATYAAMVSYLDEQVGKLVEELKQKGVYENTLIVVTSASGAATQAGVDGEYFNSAGIYPLGKGRGKGYLFESGIRVPFIASWPSVIAPNTTNQQVAVGYDLYPTLAEIVGATPTSETDGISILPALLGNHQEEQHDYLYWENADNYGHIAVRAGKWKLLARNLSYDEPYFELYDLENDPREMEDISEQNPTIVYQLVDMIFKARKSPEIAAFKLRYLED